jgi:hypothetical protein
VLAAVITGIYKLPEDERTKVMQQIPLDVLLSEWSIDLLPLIKEAGTSVPAYQRFGADQIIPRNY